MRGFMRFVRSSRLLMVGAIAFIITLAAALAAFLCDRLGVGVPWLPSGLHAVSALSGLTAGASPVLHSDMGWQYRHPWWRERLGELGIRQSMSRKGNCLDNAVIENFFGLLKSELLYLQEFSSMEHFRQELVDYLDYYNNRRIKPKLKGLPPALHRQQALSVA